jgi:Peptidase family S41
MGHTLSRRTILAALAATPVACTTLPKAPLPAASTGPALRGADIRGDIAILRRAYEQLHPGLYRYSTPTEMSARFDQLERDFSADQSMGQTYLTLSHFLGTVRCGHTYANFFNQSETVAKALFDGHNRLPFHFRWLGNRIVITRNLSGDPTLVPGTQIVSIDGIATDRILASLLPYARADGGNDAKRRALLEVQGYDGIETFDVFYPLLFPVLADGIALRVRTPNGIERAVIVGAHGPDDRKRAMSIETNPDAPQWTFAMRGAAGILTTPNWALYDSKWDWRGFLDGVFAQLASEKATGLIVDLRGNEGGLDCGHEIMARLIDKDFPLTGDERRVRYRKTPADLDPYLKTWDKSFRNWGDDAVDTGEGFYRLKSEDGDVEVIAPKGPRFTGKVVVLTDAQNSSATFQFAQRIQALGLGKLCGGATGGNQRGINGGAFFFLELPGSGLEADVPLIGRFPLTPKPDAGLTPDIAVEVTAQDIAANRDRVLETALAATT